MTSVALPTRPRSRRAGTVLLHVACALAWLLPAAYAAYTVHGAPVTNADLLATYRYTQDVIEAVREGVPIGWLLQAGPRYFPDLPLSGLAYLLSLGRPEAWGIWFALINLSLTYAALLLVLSVHGVALAKRTFIGLGFMAALLLMAVHSRYFAINLLATTFHNTLIPFVLLLYAVPAIAASRAATPALVLALAGIGAGSGLAMHSNKLLLVWGMVPVLFATAGLALVRRLSLRAVALTLATLGAAGLAYLGAAEVFERLSFVQHQEARLTEQLSIKLSSGRLSKLGQALGEYGWALAAGVPLLATLLAGATLSRYRDLPGKDARLLLFLLLAASGTAVATPAAMLTASLFSSRYFFHVMVAAALLGVTSTAMALELAGSRRFAPLTAAPAGAALAIALPVFVSHAAALQDRPAKFGEIVQVLQQQRAAGRIGENGLANYWVAHTLTANSEYVIAPLARNGLPRMIAHNGFKFWHWRAGCPYQRTFTFIITADGGPHQLQAEALRTRFGVPADVVRVAGSPFQVWLYPAGVADPDRFYASVAQRLRGMGIALGPLTRCDELPPAAPEMPSRRG